MSNKTKETIIIINDDTREASIYTNSLAMIEKIDNLKLEIIDVNKEDNGYISKLYRCPRKCISIHNVDKHTIDDKCKITVTKIFKLIDYKIDCDYKQQIAKDILELLTVFTKQEHSKESGEIALEVLKKIIE